MDGFARKLVNNIYFSFSNFTIFLKANSVVTAKTGKSVPSPHSYYAASIVKKEGKERSLSKEGKEEGRKESRKKGRHLHVYYGIYILSKRTCLPSSPAPTVFKEMI